MLHGSSKMISTVAAVLLLTTVAYSADEQCPDTEIVCYWGSWSIYRDDTGKFTTENIDPSLCTNIIYTFAGLNINSDISSLDTWADIDLGGFNNITSLKENNDCLRVTLAVGGWNEGSVKYSVMASTAEGRKKFADNALRFLIYYGFDGLDLDWEYPTRQGGIPEDGDNFASLLQTIKEAISPWGLTLTIAIPIDTSLIGPAYKIDIIKEVVDHVHLMAYDYALPSTSNVTGLSSPLSEIKKTVTTWLKAGFPANKLILGLPTYARSYLLEDDDHHDIGDPVKGQAEPGDYTREAGFLAYYELLEIIQDNFTPMQSVQTDDTNYAYGNQEWFTYETETTVRTKTQYVLDNKLGGVMVWSIDTDDFLGLYGKKYPLLTTINEVITKKSGRK